jgi:hypothetical protein
VSALSRSRSRLRPFLGTPQAVGTGCSTLTGVGANAGAFFMERSL